MTKDPIRGKVAKILNSRELVLNIGSNDGVNINMYFDVLDPKGENITDPDTSEILGSIDRPKVRVKVIKVQERLSIASTYKKEKINIGGTGVGLDLSHSFSKMLLPPQYINKYETLKTSENTWEDIDEKESYVKTGDPVIQVMTRIEDDVR